MDLKKADEEAVKGVAVRDIVADHQATRKGLRILRYAMIALCILSLVYDWMPGRYGGALGLIATAVAEFVYNLRKIK